MRQTLLLMFVGFLVLAMLFTPALSFAQSSPLPRTQISTSIFQASSVPHIVVDGNLSDWAGVCPIINGSSGEEGNPNFYGILECYVLVEQGRLYFVFQKTGGSDVWQIFFDTDLSDETGYPVSDMTADYKLELQGLNPLALSEWSGTAFSQISVPNGSVTVAWGSEASREWYEGMINLDVFGDPTVFGLVFELPFERAVAPERGYIVIEQSQSLSFAASYTGASTVNYGQPVDTTFNLLNFGPSNLTNADLEINLPKQLAFTSGQTGWQGTIPEGERLALSFLAESLDYGYATSYSNFTWIDPTSGKNRTTSVPYTTEILPNVSVDLEAPENMTVGVQSSINITITNQDPLTELLTIGGDGGFLVNGLSIVLSPNSTLQLLSVPVMPVVQGGYELDAFADYNNTDIAEAISFVTVRAPQVGIYSINNSEGPQGFPMQVDTPYSISAVIENKENVSYPVSFGITAGPGLQFINGQQVNMTLPPNSNTTITLIMKANTTGYSWASVYLNGDYGQLEYPQNFNIYVESAPNNTPILIAATVIIVLILAAALTLKRKQSQKKKKSAIQNAPDLPKTT